MVHLEEVKPVKMGIAGCGGITPSMLAGIRGVPELEVIAVQDIDAGAAERVASEFSIARHHRNYADLLADDIELVVINTPNDMHKPMALEAVAAGKHCMVQKPLARNVIEAQEMVDAAKSAGRLLGVVMLERCDPIYRQIRSMVQAGCFGRITVLSAALAHVNHLRRPPSPDNWRSSPERIGGGSFIQLAIHHLDIAQFILDRKIAQVTALTTSMIEPARFPKDETTAAVVKFHDGTLGVFLSSFATMRDSLELFGTDGMITRADEGVRWQTSELFAGEVWDSGRVGEIHELSMPDLANKVMQLMPQYEPHRLFAHAIRGTAPLETPGEIGVQTLKVVEAVRRSAEENRAISIE